jgi:hypothetical protein
MDRPVPAWNAFPWGGTVSAGSTSPTSPTSPPGPTGAGGEGEPGAEQRQDAACARQLRILMDGVSALGPGEGNST